MDFVEGHSKQRTKDSDYRRHHHDIIDTGSSWFSSFVGWLIIIGMVLVLSVGICCGRSSTSPTDSGPGDYSHSHHHAYHSEPSFHTSSGFYPSAPPPEEVMSSSSRRNSGPGFWSGAALGGVAGYAMGRSSARTESTTSASTYGNSSYNRSATESLRRRSSRDSDGDDEPKYRKSTGYGGTSTR